MIDLFSQIEPTEFQQYHKANPKVMEGIDNAKFVAYHERNPQIYTKFKEFAIRTKRKGFKNYGSKSIFELIRWHTGVSGDDQFKVDNNYTPYYARMLMNEMPEFEGFFRTRKSKADK